MEADDVVERLVASSFAWLPGPLFLHLPAGDD